MKRILKIILLGFLMLVATAAVAIFFLTINLDEGLKASLNGVDLVTVKDGTYHGIYDLGRWSNEVTVEVQDQKITKIELVKDVMIAKEGLSDSVFVKVLERQNTNIDIETGSTVTTKAYLKSIENALAK